MLDPKCKICRRAGMKLFLKADRCLSPKCSMVKRDYPPGLQSKKSRRNFTEYGKELKEKQALKKWYVLRERQFSNYVKDALSKRGKVADSGELLIKMLETRLDNVVFRAGFASSRSQARQIVNHGHFLVNGKRIDVPSFVVKKNAFVSLRPLSLKKTIFKNISADLKKKITPAWLKLDLEKLEAKIVGDPTIKESAPPAEISTIFEYYSR